MKFTKMHGIGNDYIYINCLEEIVENPNELAIKLSNVHFGVGADGVVLIMPSNKADFRMRMFNADGSEGKMCGNASRCIGKYVYERNLINKTNLTLETLSGIKMLNLEIESGHVTNVNVAMGKPILKSVEIPVSMETEEIINESLVIDNKKFSITCVSMGNPHCIVFLSTLDNLKIEEIGPKFENHTLFPERINTEFIQVVDKNNLNMRVWERGSGETFACGTGACAAVVAATLNGYCNIGEEINVKLLGGTLKIKYSEDGSVYMSGPAEFVYEGKLLCE